MDIRGKRFLVTGGGGFIGSHLVDMLLEEDAGEIVVFDNFIRGGVYNLEEALHDTRVKLFEVKGDLLHQDEVERATQNVDGVFHMASLCLAHCQRYPRAGLDVNITGTFNLLDACVRNKVDRVVFASSSSVYGNADYSPMDEEHPFKNQNFYGATKIAGEALFRAFFHKFGVDYAGLRFMNVYGPRQDYSGAYVAVIVKIIDRVQNGLRPIVHGDGSQAFDFLFVHDACRSCILAMKAQVSDQYFNISTGKQVTILALGKEILRLMGSTLEIDFQPVDDRILVNNRIGSTEKARQQLGFSAEFTLEEGLRRVIDWKLSKSPIANQID